MALFGFEFLDSNESSRFVPFLPHLLSHWHTLTRHRSGENSQNTHSSLKHKHWLIFSSALIFLKHMNTHAQHPQEKGRSLGWALFAPKLNI